jgi:hypothetical protein
MNDLNITFILYIILQSAQYSFLAISPDSVETEADQQLNITIAKRKNPR